LDDDYLNTKWMKLVREKRKMMINGKRLSDRKGTRRTRGKEINVQKGEWEKRSGYLGEKLFSWT
jgi:hypothetical protein